MLKIYRWQNSMEVYQNSDVSLIWRMWSWSLVTLHRCHSISIHWPLDCSFNRLFRLIWRLCITGPFGGNPPVTVGFPSQKAINTEQKGFSCVCHNAIIRSLSGEMCHVMAPIKFLFKNAFPAGKLCCHSMVDSFPILSFVLYSFELRHCLVVNWFIYLEQKAISCKHIQETFL